MTPHEFKNLLDRYARGECSREEESFILAWYEKIDINETDQLSEPGDIGKKLWAAIKPPQQIKPSWHIRKVAAVVSLLVVSGAALFFSYPMLFKDQSLADQIVSHPASKMVSKINTGNVAMQVELADGSEVILQPKSEIVYAKAFESATREVYLSGEAFFTVKRDTLRPFLVFADEVITQVLGTSFNVKAYRGAKEVTVAVKSGKVSVYSRAGNEALNVHPKREIILIPNQEAVYYRDNQEVSKKIVEKPEIVLPVPTLFEMQYDGTSVVKIFEVLEENYGIDIEFDEEVLSNCFLTTSMSDEGFYERIEIICKAIDATYEIKDAVVLIKSEGCL